MQTFVKRAFAQFSVALSVALSVVAIAGCKQDTCGDKVDKSLRLNPSKDSKAVLVLPMESTAKTDPLAFLLDSTIVWGSIDLNLKVKGKIPAQDDFTVIANGLKLTSKDGRSVHDGLVFETKKNTSTVILRLNKLYVNGAESFGSYLHHLKTNKGTLTLKIEVVHRDSKTKAAILEITEATLALQGLSKKACLPPPTATPTPTPAPTPTPVPEKPVTSLLSKDPAVATTASTSMVFTFASSIEGSTFFCSLDQQAPVTCTSPQTYSNLSSGSHSFRVYAQSPQGATEDVGISYPWTVDAVAPSVTITNAASLPTLTNSDAIAFEFVSSKSGGSFKCTLDGGSSSVCSSPKSLSALNEGVHTFSVTAVDALGNVSKAPATFKWSIDRTLPEASFTDITPAESVTNSLTKTFTFQASESSSFECALDGAAFAACTSPANVESLSEGDHRFEVRPIDAAKNVGSVISYAWSVDVTAPEVILGTVAPMPGLTNASAISAEFSSGEAATFYCSLDGAPSSACVSPFKAQGLSEGAHSLEITAVDVAGNIGASKQLQWNMDLSAPVLSLASVLPSANQFLSTNDVSLAVNVPEGAELSVSVNGGARVASANPLVLSQLAEGNYQVQFQAVDAAGNASDILQHSFVVDRTKPSLQLQPELMAALSNLDRNSFAISSSEESTLECSLDAAGFAACESPAVYAGLADGAHLFEARAIDRAGNVSAIAEHRWVIDTEAPVTSLSANVQGTNATFTISSSEAGASFVCSLDGGELTPCGAVVALQNLSLGSHSFQAKAIDAAGNMDPAGANHSFTVVEPIHTALVSKVPADSMTNLTSMTFTFTASQENATFLCSIDGGASIACQSPYSYSGIKDGSHSFTVRAVDAFGNVDALGATHSWVVDTQAPIVSGIATSATTNTITVSWTTDEPATTQLRYGLGFTVSQSTAEITALTTTHSVKLSGLSSNSTYTVQVYSRDALGNATLSATRTVKTNR